MVSAAAKKLVGEASDALMRRRARQEPSPAHLEEIQIPAREIPVDQIRRSPYQPRLELDTQHIQELADSISATGLANPISVRVVDENTYELIAGEHRWEAYKLLGQADIPAFVRRLSDEQAVLLTIVENIKRKDLSDFEQGCAYANLHATKVVTGMRELSRAMGVNEGHISRCMSMTKLPEAAIDILRTNPRLIGATAGSKLARMTESGHGDLVVEALRLVLTKKLTQDSAVTWVRQHAGLAPEAKSGKRPVTAFAVGDSRVNASSVVKGRKVLISAECPTDVSPALVEQAFIKALKSLNLR